MFGRPIVNEPSLVITLHIKYTVCLIENIASFGCELLFKLVPQGNKRCVIIHRY